MQIWDNTSGDINAAARQYKASPIVIARRALDLGKLTKGQFFNWYNAYKEQLDKHKEAAGGGGDFYNTAKRRVGLRFAAFVDRAIQERRLFYKDAYRLTGLRGDTYQTFIAKNLR